MTLQNKIDFVALVSVNMANANGDPLNGNRPRTDYNGFGEISDVCVKRKIRNRMQDMGQNIFVQSDDRADDGKISLKDRADGMKSIKSQTEFAQEACRKWLDVRTFGQVFAFKGFNCASVGVRGPVSIHQAVSVDPVEVVSMQITKSVSGDRKNESERGSDTMGQKHFVRFGLYKIKGSINIQLAEKTGFSVDDAAIVKECMRTLFTNDASSARPDGSMEVVKLFWFEHNCKDGQYSTAEVHRSVKVARKADIEIPTSIEDYDIALAELPGLNVEVLKGI